MSYLVRDYLLVALSVRFTVGEVGPLQVVVDTDECNADRRSRPVLGLKYPRAGFLNRFTHFPANCRNRCLILFGEAFV